MPEPSKHSRAKRLAVLLAILCVFHAFNLALTQAQIDRPGFMELNSLARAAIGDAPRSSEFAAVRLAGYKCGLFGLGVAILWGTRRRWEAECGAWFALAVSAGLMIWWKCYLHNLEICLGDPACVSGLIAY